MQWAYAASLECEIFWNNARDWVECACLAVSGRGRGEWDQARKLIISHGLWMDCPCYRTCLVPQTDSHSTSWATHNHVEKFTHTAYSSRHTSRMVFTHASFQITNLLLYFHNIILLLSFISWAIVLQKIMLAN